MKGKIKSFLIGVICGGMLLGGVGYATNTLQIEVTMPHIPYIYDGQELSLAEWQADGELIPQTINYLNVNYVSVRALAEALGKEVAWDAAEGKVFINSMEQVNFTEVTEEEMSPDIVQWVERSKQTRAVLLKESDDHLYILLTLGEKASGGYEVDVKEIKQYHDGLTIIAEETEPQKGMLVTGAMTYPYQLVKISNTYEGPVRVEYTMAE